MRQIMPIIMSAVFLLTGCFAPALDYADPPRPTQWTTAQDQDGKVKDLTGWWKHFDDDILNELVAIALADSPQRNIAKARILEARGVLRNARSGLFPHINGSTSASRGESVSGNTASNYDARFDASFELDLFGQTRKRVSADRQAAKAAEARYDDITLTLIADIVRSYINFRAAQKQERIAARNVELQEKTLEIVKALFEAGEITRLEAERADAQVNTTRATISTFIRQSDAARLSLSVLTGELPEELAPMLNVPASLPSSDMQPVLEAPADIIARRPDIRAAQADLMRATDLGDAAVRDLFPTITLSGLFGVSDDSFVPSNTIWNIAAGAAVALLDFGALEGKIDAARARERQAFEQYRLTLLEAVTEIETALSDTAHINAQHIALQQAYESAIKAFNLSRDLYAEGEIAFIDLLDAQREVNAAGSRLVDAQASHAESLARLYKSLGIY